MDRLAIDLQKTAQWGAALLYIGLIGWILLGIFVSPWFHIGTVITIPFVALNIYYKRVQKKHTLLRNFGILAAARYLFESIGPEMRQYFFSNDTEERPFTRTQRTEVYRKAKNLDSTEAFGSQLEFDKNEMKLRHSMFPVDKTKMEPYSVTFGADTKNPYVMKKHMMVSAMSFGSLGANAIKALSKGAKKAGIALNTGEGGLSKYHLSGGCDLVFQMGTAKFGVRNHDGTLNDEKLKKIASRDEVKMVEIKFSQGAKPGKGGLLPKEKITEEIAKIRGIPMDKDVVSPPRHKECDTVENTVTFIKHVKDVSELPVGIKLCLGNENEFVGLVKEMKKQKVFPSYIALDGSEGATGAAPKSFMDHVGVPLFPALDTVVNILEKEKVRDKIKIIASGKLINPGRQLKAIAHGADAIYSARGFMLAMGCIQALECNTGTCPVGITTHDPVLQRGLVVDEKATRVANYVKNIEKDFVELLAATGSKSISELTKDKVYNA